MAAKTAAPKKGDPKDPQVIFAGTQKGVYRSGDRGDHWEKLDSPDGEVWSMTAHPKDPNIMFAGYDRSKICRTERNEGRPRPT